MLKHVTPTQFIWAIFDKDGKVESVLGGPYTLKGDKYEETPEYRPCGQPGRSQRSKEGPVVYLESYR